MIVEGANASFRGGGAFPREFRRAPLGSFAYNSIIDTAVSDALAACSLKPYRWRVRPLSRSLVALAAQTLAADGPTSKIRRPDLL